MKQFPLEMASMIDGLSQALEDWSVVLPKPSHGPLVEDWKGSMKEYVTHIYPEDDVLVDSITAGLLEAYTAWTEGIDGRFIGPVDHDQTHELMLRPQTAQRTADWYTEFQKCLTASELSKVFGSPRERGTLVMQKAGKLEIPGRTSQKKVCYKEQMSPFDWGICFEPVVNQILELEWDAMFYECGRFVHPRDPRFAASPDGLILRSKIHPEMGGHLLEIKCPKSRKIGVKIPMEYYYQMQLQLEVTGVRACEYVEAKFEFVSASCQIEDPSDLRFGTRGSSVNVRGANPDTPVGEILTSAVDGTEETKDSNNNRRTGMIAVVGAFNEDSGTWLPSKYVYGPVGNLDWKPDLGLNEQTLQMNRWVCPAFHHERVLRDETWFGTLWPKLEAFWADVALAKTGEFTLPESSRKKKDVACEIVDSEPEDSSPNLNEDPDIKTVVIR